jgi:hypothetical protein
VRNVRGSMSTAPSTTSRCTYPLPWVSDAYCECAMACGVDLGRHIEPLTHTRRRHSGVSGRTMAVARARKAETLEYNYKIWSDLPSKSWCCAGRVIADVVDASTRCFSVSVHKPRCSHMSLRTSIVFLNSVAIHNGDHKWKDRERCP